MGHPNLQPTSSTFHQQFYKNTADIETDIPDIVENLNTHLTKAVVDPWQTTRVVPHPTTYEQPKSELPQDRSVVTLTATVEERFANTLISRDGEPDYVPLTTNLGLK